VGLWDKNINPLNAELNFICHLLTLLGAHHILHVSRIRVNVDCREVDTCWRKYEGCPDQLCDPRPHINSYMVNGSAVTMWVDRP